MSLPFIDGKSSAEESQKGFFDFPHGTFFFLSLFLSLSDIGRLIIDSLGESKDVMKNSSVQSAKFKIFLLLKFWQNNWMKGA